MWKNFFLSFLMQKTLELLPISLNFSETPAVYVSSGCYVTVKNVSSIFLH